MPSRTDLFYNNRLYKLLSNSLIYSNELLQEINSLLHEQPELIEYNHPIEGSFFHIICRNSNNNNQQNIAFRMIYALSNAGADPNVIDGKGNTPLHEALIQGVAHCGFDLIQALFRVGVDQRIVNHEGKTADAYLKDNPKLETLYKGYGDGIWAAIENSNIQEIERLVKGFIKVDCKHNSNKTLLDKACDLDSNASIISLLAEYQVTTEFLHSILACDWERALIIYKHENKYLKIDSVDTIHRLTFIRTYSKSLLEYCLDTYSSKPFEILYESSQIKININVLCTDGLPFFFHCFNSFISNDIRKKMLLNCNIYMKSSKGETILFYLLRLYSENENSEYLNIFINILSNHPLFIVQRNENEQTIIELIEFSTSIINYQKFRPFYEAIMKILIVQLKKNSIIEKYILYNFGYYLLIFFKNKTLEMTKYVYQLLRSLKYNQGLPILISDMMQSIIDNDLIKLKNIFKIKSFIFQAKDSFGRTCAHLAVLYQRYDILKFICHKYPKVIDGKDNLYRTSFHYACIMNDKVSIEILEQAHARQIIDCLNFCPNDYVVNRDLCSEQYSAEDFVKQEIQRKSFSISNYLKIAFYPRLKKAIQMNSVEEIKLIHTELIQMGYHLKDFNPNSYLNDYVQGERYIPLLFLTIEYRSILSLQCLIELGIPLIGQMYISKSKMNVNTRWISFRSRAEELECFDIIDIINDLEDDIELKNIFQQHLFNNETITAVKLNEKEKIPKQKQKILPNLFLNENIKSQACILL